VTEGLVERLQAAIDEVEKDANEGHAFGCAVATPCYEPPYEAGPDYSLCDCRQRSVLRLCQAHRDILNIWKYSAFAKEKFGTSATTERLLTMNEIVEALARGYGLEDR
jgi:hypothetical protein